MERSFRSIIFRSLTLAAVFVLGVQYARSCRGSQIRDLDRVWQEVENNYAGGPVDRDKMLRGALAGLIGSLASPNDTFSAYFDPDMEKMFESGNAGKISSWGLITDIRTDPPTIVGVRPNSPAAKAGVYPGDRLLAVNGRRLVGLTRQDVYRLGQGPNGAKFRLLIGREGAAKPLPVEFILEPSSFDLVSWRPIPTPGGKLALIQIASFTGDAAAKFDQAYAEALKEGVRGLIIDLRGDPGGETGVTAHIAGAWLGSRVCMIEVDAQGHVGLLTARGGASLAGLPTVVLVDGGSASASEVLAGALQDHGQAKLVGARTFGKGVGQAEYRLRDGSLIELVVFRWFTPKGRSIHGAGLEPDLTVALTVADRQAGRDPQLDAAVRLLAPAGR